jgi:putative glycosyltransferase (TIGR04372 family)
MNPSLDTQPTVSVPLPNPARSGEGVPVGQRRRIFYFLYGIASFGQMVAEVFWLRNIFDQPGNLFTIITHPLTDRVNQACYDFVMRGIDVRHIPDYRLPKYGRGIHGVNGDLYVVEDGAWLENTFPAKMCGRNPSFHYSLTPEDREQGRRLWSRLGIPADAPVVVLHNRESGWQPTLTYHSYRNADIERCLPAVDYLLRRGYYVVRIGDRSVKPLPKLSDRLLDMPFHPLYHPSVELYCTAMCRFFVSVPSGPLSFAVAFNKPVVWINSPIVSYHWGNPLDLLVPKKYYSHRLKRYLTYAEIVTSPLIDFSQTEEFSRFGVELHENTPDELLRSVQEMDARLDSQDPYSASRRQVHDRFKAIQGKGHRFCQHVRQRFSWYGMMYSHMQLSNAFDRQNPWFLEDQPWR